MWTKAIALGLMSLVLVLAPWTPSDGGLAPRTAYASGECPTEMAKVEDYCIDRWEVHAVDDKTGALLSPFYPPEPVLLAKVYQFWSTEADRTGDARARALPVPPIPEVQQGKFTPRAVSAPGVLPQGYMTYYSAKRACETAGKRLCSEEEWARACRGRRGTKHPYGGTFRLGACNVFREIHPAYELHGNSSLGHLDPRLHLVVDSTGKPLLMDTGAMKGCATEVRDGQLFDMEGNLDEWIDDPRGSFVGGFFSRQTREGCEAKIENHAPAYTDYSLGTRCCRDAR